MPRNLLIKSWLSTWSVNRQIGLFVLCLLLALTQPGHGRDANDDQLLFQGHISAAPSRLIPAAPDFKSAIKKDRIGEGQACFRANHPQIAIKEVADETARIPLSGYGRIDQLKLNGEPMFNKKCSVFISEKGLGEWGEYVVALASQIAPDCFYRRNLFGKLCPNYLELDVGQKNAMIALAFAAIGQGESSCNPKNEAPGKNDAADGMFGLERSYRSRKRANRDSTLCKTEGPVDSKDMRFQTECAVSTVRDTVCSWKTVIFDAGGYWQDLNREKDPISERIRITGAEWGLCR